MISYEVKMDNELLKGESYKVSKVLAPKGKDGLQSGEWKVVKSCEIIPQENLGAGEMQKFLKTYQEEVLDCLYASGIKLYDEAVMQNLQARSKTIFKIPPKRVIAMLKDGIVNLSVLEKR